MSCHWLLHEASLCSQESKPSQEEAPTSAYTAPKRGGKKALKDAIKRREEAPEVSSREADLSAYKSPAVRAAEQQAEKAAAAMSTAPPQISTPEPEAQAPKVEPPVLPGRETHLLRHRRILTDLMVLAWKRAHEGI